MDPSQDQIEEITMVEEDSSKILSDSIEEVTTGPMDCTITLSGDEEEGELNENQEVEKVSDLSLPPGAAPSGFEIVDEVYCDKDEKQDEVEKTPLVTITFRDNDVAGRYKKKFMTFLNDVIMKKNDNCMTQWKNLVLEVWGTLSDESVETLDGSVSSENVNDNFENLFVVDTTPTIKDDLDIPTYGKKFEKILNKNGIQENPANEDNKTPKMTCFNCLGNHNLKDCTQPRNQANINKHRKDFNSRQRSNTRYHQDDDQKFDHLVPGKLSDNLKQALNLKENELPRYIYRMRQLGYPPGWLEEAKLQHSGLSLFNSQGVAEGEPDDEEGEIINLANKDKYDINKIIEFPGFNVRPPRGTYDELKHYWGTELQLRNSKSSMLNELMDKKVDEGYKKKKLKKGVPVAYDSKIEAKDMDIEIVDEDVVVETMSENGLFVPPLPKEDAKPPEPPVTLEDSDESPTSTQEDTAVGSPQPDSPSLSDLEFAKKNILFELQDSSQPNPESPKTEVSLDTSVRTGTPGTPSTPGSNRGSIKFVDLGTPIIQSASPYNKLPSSEKFSKDICDVIYFENLPDSTGKYEQMSGLIQKVRTKLAEINKE